MAAAEFYDPAARIFRERCDLRDASATVDIALYAELLWPDPVPEDMIGGSGFNAAVVVLRAILTQLPPPYRAVKDADAEAQNPILAFAFTHWPLDAEVVAATGDLIHHVKARVDPTGRSFFDIMEDGLMRATFWKNEVYHLFSPQLLLRRSGDSDWVARGNNKSPAEEAARSLVRWDGSVPIGEHISKKFGLFQNEQPRFECFLLPRFPNIIRVLVTPDAHPITADDVHRVCVASPEGDGSPTGTPAHYYCLATVRLRRDENEDDLIRLYSPRGFYRVPMDTLDSRVPRTYIEDTWKFGEPGHSYMVYLALRSVGEPLELPGPLGNPVVPPVRSSETAPTNFARLQEALRNDRPPRPSRISLVLQSNKRAHPTTGNELEEGELDTNLV